MAREPRIVPPGSLQHVVDVMFQHRFLLRPSAELNTCFVGVLGRAQKKYKMTICAVAVLSGHYHLLLRPRNARHLAEFMCFLKTNLSKEVGRLHSWSGNLFNGRYFASTVPDIEKDQVAALSYVLSQGVKEGLVDRVREWPGIHCGPALMDGTVLEGVWRNRTADYRSSKPTPKEAGEAREMSPAVMNTDESVSTEEVRLSPLPCWESLPEEKWRAWVRDLVSEIEARARVERAGRPCMGVKKICAMDPHHCPNVQKVAQARFQSSSKDMRRRLREMRRELVVAYRKASEELRHGDAEKVVREQWFPEGMFPCALSFVPIGAGHFLGTVTDGGRSSDDLGPEGGRGQPS